MAAIMRFYFDLGQLAVHVLLYISGIPPALRIIILLINATLSGPLFGFICRLIFTFITRIGNICMRFWPVARKLIKQLYGLGFKWPRSCDSISI